MMNRQTRNIWPETHTRRFRPHSDRLVAKLKLQLPP